MKLILHTRADQSAAEVVSESIILQSEQDVIGLLEEMYGLGARKIILHQKNIAPEFFDLKTGLAGAVLQKFVTYQIQVAIVGDFSNVTSSAQEAFIFESNRGNQVCFVSSLEAAVLKIFR